MEVSTLTLKENKPMEIAAIEQRLKHRKPKYNPLESVNKAEFNYIKHHVYHKAFNQVNKVCVNCKKTKQNKNL